MLQVSLIEMPVHGRKQVTDLTTNVMRDESDKVSVDNCFQRMVGILQFKFHFHLLILFDLLLTNRTWIPVVEPKSILQVVIDCARRAI